MFNSFCIISDSITTGKQYTKDWIVREKIQPVDVFDLTESDSGIAEVRAVKTFLSRKPFASPKKAVVIEGDLLTLEAQNALLKTLEEPPQNSVIFILTTTEDKLLPTILSRCTTHKLLSKTQLTAQDNISTRTFWQTLFRQSIADRLKQTPLLAKDRAVLNDWLKTQITGIRSELFLAYSQQAFWISPKECVHLLRVLITTQKYIGYNVNLRLALDHLFIHTPRHV